MCVVFEAHVFKHIQRRNALGLQYLMRLGKALLHKPGVWGYPEHFLKIPFKRSQAPSCEVSKSVNVHIVAIITLHE